MILSILTLLSEKPFWGCSIKYMTVCMYSLLLSKYKIVFILFWFINKLKETVS